MTGSTVQMKMAKHACYLRISMFTSCDDVCFLVILSKRSNSLTKELAGDSCCPKNRCLSNSVEEKRFQEPSSSLLDLFILFVPLDDDLFDVDFNGHLM